MVRKVRRMDDGRGGGRKMREVERVCENKGIRREI